MTSDPSDDMYYEDYEGYDEPYDDSGSYGHDDAYFEDDSTTYPSPERTAEEEYNPSYYQDDSMTSQTTGETSAKMYTPSHSDNSDTASQTTEQMLNSGYGQPSYASGSSPTQPFEGTSSGSYTQSLYRTGSIGSQTPNGSSSQSMTPSSQMSEMPFQPTETRSTFYGLYDITASGTNSQVRIFNGSQPARPSRVREQTDLLQGNHWCNRNYGPDARNRNAYHYSNADGSYFYSNPDGKSSPVTLRAECQADISIRIQILQQRHRLQQVHALHARRGEEGGCGSEQ